jgi:hypothetical protein
MTKFIYLLAGWEQHNAPAGFGRYLPSQRVQCVREVIAWRERKSYDALASAWSEYAEKGDTCRVLPSVVQYWKRLTAFLRPQRFTSPAN